MVLIIGGSGVGKTYILQNIDKIGDRYEVVKKYTTRKARKNEDQNDTIDLYLNCSKEEVCACEYSYKYREEWYGFNKRDIEVILNRNHVPLFVVRRMDTICRLKKEYPESKVLLCKSGLNKQELFEYLLKKGNSVQDLEKRLDEKYEVESRLEYEQYSDLIDYCVTNNYDEKFLEEIKICIQNRFLL